MKSNLQLVLFKNSLHHNSNHRSWLSILKLYLWWKSIIWIVHNKTQSNVNIMLDGSTCPRWNIGFYAQRKTLFCIVRNVTLFLIRNLPNKLPYTNHKHCNVLFMIIKFVLKIKQYFLAWAKTRGFNNLTCFKNVQLKSLGKRKRLKTVAADQNKTHIRGEA